ncbi:hypothetical protein BJ970_003431 [Saccharopolyspora phatthalungensis]|uniref:Uncharacterized protein n=1 Tax=Saccharopolyspora phatthalungensis TaxID=664693 RepID=A0A840Q7H8_9PSEU|nr:hypothetical protein [Saccharopolyspora phatthalungensis]
MQAAACGAVRVVAGGNGQHVLLPWLWIDPRRTRAQLRRSRPAGGLALGGEQCPLFPRCPLVRFRRAVRHRLRMRGFPGSTPFESFWWLVFWVAKDRGVSVFRRGDRLAGCRG